jgi:hypothetical protein
MVCLSCVRNGSQTQPASMRPLRSAEPISGHGSCTYFTDDGSTPALSSAAFIDTSPTFFSVLTAMVVPLSSLTLDGPSAAAMMWQ